MFNGREILRINGDEWLESVHAQQILPPAYAAVSVEGFVYCLEIHLVRFHFGCLNFAILSRDSLRQLNSST